MSSTLSPSAASEPLKSKERILFLDCVRGIALLGILLMNSMAQSQPHQYYENMNLSQPITGLNFYAWVFECVFFEGTMRGLFSILFGAGTVLLLDRLTKEKPGLEPADIFYRRMLWLLVFGLINAFIFLWPGDILYPYALCGLLLFPFRNWSPKGLLWGVVLLLAFSTYRQNSSLYDNKAIVNKGQAVEKLDTTKVKLTSEQKEDLQAFKDFREKHDTAGIAKAAREESKKIKNKSYAQIFKYFKRINMEIESWVFYNSWWDMLMMFFLGIAMYRSGFLLGKKSTGVYVIVSVVGIAIGLALNYFYLGTAYRLRFDEYKLVQRISFAAYDVRRLCQTTGYLSLLILLYRVGFFKKMLGIFAPVGQMAFTNYLSQSIITSIIFHGFHLFDTLQRYQVYYVVVSIWIFQIIFSHIWLRYFRFGPFEWVWRALTYRTRPPMLRKAELEAS